MNAEEMRTIVDAVTKAWDSKLAELPGLVEVAVRQQLEAHSGHIMYGELRTAIRKMMDEKLSIRVSLID